MDGGVIHHRSQHPLLVFFMRKYILSDSFRLVRWHTNDYPTYISLILSACLQAKFTANTFTLHTCIEPAIEHFIC